MLFLCCRSEWITSYAALGCGAQVVCGLCLCSASALKASCLSALNACPRPPNLTNSGSVCRGCTTSVDHCSARLYLEAPPRTWLSRPCLRGRSHSVVPAKATCGAHHGAGNHGSRRHTTLPVIGLSSRL
jgi:hypothetical protein